MSVCVCLFSGLLPQRNNAASSLSAPLNHPNCMKAGRVSDDPASPVSSASNKRLKYHLWERSRGWFFTAAWHSDLFSCVYQHIFLLFFSEMWDLCNSKHGEEWWSAGAGDRGPKDTISAPSENFFDSASIEWHILQMSFPELPCKSTFRVRLTQ